MIEEIVAPQEIKWALCGVRTLRRTLLGASFNATLLETYLRFGRLTDIRGYSLKQRLVMSMILNFCPDRRSMREYLLRPDKSSDTSQAFSIMAAHLFLLSRVARIRLSVADDDLLLTISKGGFTDKFRLNPVPGARAADFVHDFYPFTDTYFLSLYDFYDYSNGVVVDIGGYLGETSVYFAKRGAERVHVYETNPVNYEYLVENLRGNGINGKVDALNIGISTGVTRLAVPRDRGGAGSLHYAEADVFSYDVEIVEPASIFNRDETISLLKLDCKGCEYDVLTQCRWELVRNVSHVIVQVDRLPLHKIRYLLRELVSCGFKVDQVNWGCRMVYLTNCKLNR